MPVYAHIHKYLNCRGLGLCGTCAVMVKKGAEHLSKKSLMEKFTFATHPIKSFQVIGHEDEVAPVLPVPRRGRRGGGSSPLVQHRR